MYNCCELNEPASIEKGGMDSTVQSMHIIKGFEGNAYLHIIESVDSINRDERGFPLTQYITNGGISSARNTSTHFKHNHRVLRLISNRMSV